MKRGFVILFIELFCVQASLFLEALLQEYALFCQIMLLFFLFHIFCIFQLFLKKAHLLNQQFVSFFSDRNVVKSPGYDQTAEKI